MKESLMSNIHTNALKAQSDAEKAIERAKSLAGKDPVLAPYFMRNISLEQAYVESRQYNQQFFEKIVELLRMPSGDRPLIPLSVGDKTTPKVKPTYSTAKPSYSSRRSDDWGRPYCDY
jgi:hypothetical protein